MINLGRNHLLLQEGFIQMIKHVACKNLCHASYDLGFDMVTYVAWHMCHATYVIVWVHLKCVEMGKLDCGMGICTSDVIHSYLRGEIMLIVLFLRI